MFGIKGADIAIERDWLLPIGRVGIDGTVGVLTPVSKVRFSKHAEWCIATYTATCICVSVVEIRNQSQRPTLSKRVLSKAVDCKAKRPKRRRINAGILWRLWVFCSGRLVVHPLNTSVKRLDTSPSLPYLDCETQSGTRGCWSPRGKQTEVVQKAYTCMFIETVWPSHVW